MQRALAAVAAALLLAGCGDPGSDPTSTTTSDPVRGPGAPAPGAVTLAGCEGFHAFFPAPADGFDAYVPENFTLRTDASGAVQVPVFAFACANATVEMWALLPVVPPEPLRNESYAVDAVVLTAYTTNGTLHDAYLAWGFAPGTVLRAGEHATEFVQAGVASADRIAIGNGSRSYELRTTVQEDRDPFGAEVYRYWIVNGTRATGWADARSSASEGIGAGPASFQSEGDADAPPITVGLGHRVSGVAMQLRWHPLDNGQEATRPGTA